MLIVSRTKWQDPFMPVKGPAIRLSAITTIPAHYTAAETVPTDTASYLRSIQRDYTVNRGYSIGYNFALDQYGVAWECRGFDIKCAANAGHNDETIAILCLVDGNQPMNEAMVFTFKALVTEAQHRTGRTLKVVGHRDIGSTLCPGAGIYAQVRAGDLIPRPRPEPPKPPEDDMTIQVFESHSEPKEFHAMFFATCDGQGRAIELQWSGDGNDPRVQERVATMLDNFGPSKPLTLGGIRNCRLHAKHRPSDIHDSLHVWTDTDFAP